MNPSMYTFIKQEQGQSSGFNPRLGWLGTKALHNARQDRFVPFSRMSASMKQQRRFGLLSISPSKSEGRLLLGLIAEPRQAIRWRTKT